MGLGLTFLLSLSSLSLFLGPSLSDFQVLCIERKALSLDSSISMTMLKSEQVGMQRDWLKTNFMPLIRSRSSWPCSSTTTTFFFFLFTFLSIFPVVNRLGMVRRLQIYGKTTGLPIFECPIRLASLLLSAGLLYPMSTFLFSLWPLVFVTIFSSSEPVLSVGIVIAVHLLGSYIS